MCQIIPLSLFLSLYRYRHILQWHDGSVAFVNAFSQNNGKCSYMMAWTMSALKFLHMHCTKPHRNHYLCEFSSKQHKQTLSRRNLQPGALLANMTQYPVDHVVCLEGHVTHALFACDARTSCWAERHHVEVDLTGSPVEGSCPAPVAPLPPYFRCQRGLQVVAYTVLCDHREDCADGSDEDFCVYPACQPSTEIMCNNKQVSLLIICCY